MRHHRIATAVVAAAAALTLAACGSSSSTTASTPAPASSSPAASTPAAAGTIVDVAAANPDFTTLVAAVKAAGLVETLSGTGPFTVFAPTNAAFEALPAGLLDKLLKPENKEALTKILTYHVLASEVKAADVKPGKVATVEGSDITITTDGGVKVNDATVTATDVLASNGVIHVIDK
ncbi:MAG: fasciclin domain-containing protein, partial [Candidatus Nanopelagicales bacterium]